MSEAAKAQVPDLVVTLTQEQLRALIGEEVRAALANGNARAEDEPVMLTLKQTAQKMQVSTRTLTAWAKLGMPFSRPGNEWRFDLAEVREWARKTHRVKKAEK